MLSPVEDSQQETTDLDNDPLSLDDLDFEELTGSGGEEEDLPVDTEEVEVEEKESKKKKTKAPEDTEEETDTEEEEKDDEESKSETEEEQSEETEESSEDETDSEETEEGEEQTIIGKLAELTGFEFEDEEFSEDYEGIAKYAGKVGEKMAEQELDALFEEYPDVAEFLQYRLNGGDPDAFFDARKQELDYSKMELQEDDTQTQERVLREHFKLQGWEDEDVKNAIEEYKAAGILHSNATRALKGLRSYQQKRREELLEEQEKRAEAQEDALKKHVQSLSKTVQESKDLAGFPIVEKDKKKFIDYLTKTNGEGATQAQLQMSKLSEEQQLALNYLVFKGLKLEDIVNNQASTKRAQELKDKLNKNKEKLRNAESRKREKKAKNTAPDLSELEDIF